MELSAHQPAPDSLEHYRETLDVVCEIFGLDRLVYGSKWPRVELFGGYRTERQLVETYLQGQGPEALNKVMGQNARIFYDGSN